MLVVRSRILIYLFSVTSLVAVPIAFPTSPTPVPTHLLGILVALEVLVFSAFIAIRSTGVGLIPILVGGLGLSAIRLTCCVFGFMLLGAPDLNELLQLWWGKPLSIAVQILVLFLLAPYTIGEFAPGLLGEEMEKYFRQWATSVRGTESVALRVEHEVPGFYNYRELGNYLEKWAHLRAGVLFDNEGLTLWRVAKKKVHVSNLLLTAIQVLEAMETIKLLRKDEMVWHFTGEQVIAFFQIDGFGGAALAFDKGVGLEETLLRIRRFQQGLERFLRLR